MPPKTLLEFVLAYSRSAQATIIAVTALSFPIAYLTLELPKQIIDDAILGTGFPRAFWGFSLSQVDYLLLLCGGFFSLFILSNALKYVLNVLRGITGERLLRRMRYMLVGRIMRLKQGDERKYSAGEVVQITVAELQPIGGFVGEYFAVPVMQGGTLLVYFLFIFMQDPLLGLASVALFPVQAYIIPLMQRRVIRLTQARIANARLLSDQVAENVDGIEAFRRHGALDWRMAQLSERLFENFKLRYQLFKQKFLIKFVNNLLSQVMPFFFYTLGGYLVITGRLEIGALVAAIAAYKELSNPWRELLKYYETHSDLSVRYASIVERWSEGEEEPASAAGQDTPPPPGPLAFGPLRVGDAAVTAAHTVQPGSVVSIIGGEATARGALTRSLCGAQPPSAGRATLGGRSLGDLSHPARSRVVGLIEPQPFFPRGSLRDALTLSLMDPKSVEPGDLELGPWWERVAALTVDMQDAVREARASGNFALDPHAPKLDLAQAAVEDAGALDRRILDLALALGVERPIFESGLSARIDPVRRLSLSRALLDMRAALTAEGASGLEDVVEPWRPDELNRNAPLIENILYAAARDPEAPAADLETNRELDAWLKGAPVEATLLDIGAQLIEATADLLDGQAPDSPLLRGFDLYPADKVDLYRSDALRFRSAPQRLSRSGRRRLLGVALLFTPRRRRLNILTPERIEALVAARSQASALILAAAYDAPGADFAPIRADRYLPGLTVRENLLLGKLRLDRRDQWGRINARIWRLAKERGVELEIAALGLDTAIEPGLRNLQPDQRERFAILRALLSRPRVLGLDGPGGSDSPADLALIQNLRRTAPETILVVTRSAGPIESGADVVVDLSGAARATDRDGAGVSPSGSTRAEQSASMRSEAESQPAGGADVA
ncbi:MAG: ABC transporter transmembrane domain-containing protein [Pseudomonadota bacterium]